MSAIDEIPAVGSLIAGKYEVERVLGSGGMGIVVAAKHVQLGQRVAIKVLRPTALADPAAAARFLREAQAAVALTSDHVTKVLDVGALPSGAPFMVMECLAGIDLAEHLLKSGPMAVVDAIDAMLQACEAIAEAHARGIIHRDLKPSNLFLSRRIDGAPFVKVLDFGISKTSSLSGLDAPAGGLTVTGLAMGSPSYMSPEQVRNAKAADPRSDVWSMGVILYQLLTGVAPFAGETIGETFARILSEDPVPIRQLRHEIPEGLADTIAQCLERRLPRRVQTIAQLAMQMAPFGAPDAAIAARRVVHVSRSAAIAQAGGETLAAPTPGRAAGINEASSGSRPPSAWQQSGVSATPGPRQARAAWVVAVGGTAIALFAVVLGLHMRRRADLDDSLARAGSASAQALPAASLSGSPEVDPPVARVPPLEESNPDSGGWKSAPPEDRGGTGSPLPVASTFTMPHGAPVEGMSRPEHNAAGSNARDAGARQREPRPPASTVTPSRPNPDCAPPYTLDDSGQKHFKPECFQ